MRKARRTGEEPQEAFSTTMTESSGMAGEGYSNVGRGLGGGYEFARQVAGLLHDDGNGCANPSWRTRMVSRSCIGASGGAADGKGRALSDAPGVCISRLWLSRQRHATAVSRKRSGRYQDGMFIARAMRLSRT